MHGRPAQIVHLFGGALLRHLVILTQDGGQTQGFQMVFQQDLRRVDRLRVPLSVV